MYRCKFEYDNRGYGDLIIYNGDTVVDYWECRSGSIDTAGKLVHAIDKTLWRIIEKSVETSEIAMIVDGYGRKSRLYRVDDKGVHWTHYLVHPDGNKPGSEGCIVTIQGTPVARLIALFALLDLIVEEQGSLDVTVK